MTVATREQKLLKLENSKIKTKTIKDEIKGLKEYLIKFKANYSDAELASKEEIYKFAIADFRAATSPIGKKK